MPMNPRTKLAFFGDDDDDLVTLQSKPIDDQKAKTYTQGTHRKTKREKEKEAEQAKKEEEEKEAAKAYAEFLDAFDAPEAPPPGAVVVKGKAMGFVKASDQSGRGEVYAPTVKKEVIPSGPRVRQREPSPPPPPGPPKAKGKRAMDAFLEEIKRDQADREARLKIRTQATGSSVSALAAFESQQGSRDRGDPLTTNIFVANLPMGITEHNLGMFFARHGPVGSVKIMWPRSDANAGGPGGDIASRRGKGGGMSGFVSYMTRKAAEDCVREFDGYNWNGCVLRVGWSKAVPIAARPAYVLEEDYRRRSRSKSKSRSRSQERDRDRRPAKRARYGRSGRSSRSRSYSSKSRSRSRSPERRRRSPSRSRSGSESRSRSRSRERRRKRSRSTSRRRRSSPSRSRSRSRDRNRRRSRSPNRRQTYRSNARSYSRSRSRSRSPEQRRWPPIEEETRSFVITVANRVKDHGTRFGDVLKHRERDNPKFAFLYDKRLPEYHLFRSIAESNYKCPFADIPFRDDGDHSVYSTDAEEEAEKERVRKGSLGKLAHRRFEILLRGLSGLKGEIARCMAFSLEHADAVVEVVDIIISSLLVESTPVPRKIARLHLICDILHNSAATIPNAWKFRQEFQARLPPVFDHLSEIYHSFPGRITAETFKKQVLAVVEVWEDWIIFGPEFTTDLRERLDGKKREGDEQVEDDGMAIDVDGGAAPEVASGPVSKFKSSTFKPAEDPPPETKEEEDMELDSDDDIEGEAIALDGDELDG